MPNPPTLTEDEQPREITRFVDWYRRHPDKSESTATRYRTALRKWAVYCDEHDVPLLDADSRDVEDFILGLYDDYAPKTVSNARAALSQFYQREGDFEDKTPVDEAEVGSWNADSVKSGEGRDENIHWLKPEQVESLIENVPAPTLRNRLLVKLMVQTGVRASELQTIRCGQNPDWESNELGDIDRKERRIVVKDKKNDDTRPVFYHQNIDDILRLWIETERATVYKASESEYLFPTTKSESIHPQRINSIVREAAEKAGIQRTYAKTADGRERAEVTSHVLRHTFAMNALRNDMDTRWIQLALGHSDISTTINRYLHEDEDTLKKQWTQRGPSF
ncbi:tyrosine-type recombinase/integrase [Halogeometricum borinquense]|uniref:tyrosine-type recombinase/integrase n=1 Tax=Halogeometricum borinquense TaxID=60847 RepID=UPI003430D1C3